MTPAILNNAEQLVRSIDPSLIPDKLTATGKSGAPKGTKTTAVHNHYHDSYWGYRRPLFFYDSPVYCSNGPQSSERKRDNLVLILGAAAFVALVTSYFVGRDVAKVVESGKQIKILDAQNGELDEQPKVQEVIKIQKQMLADIQETSKTGLVLKAALGVSALALGAGTFMAAPAVAAAGWVSGGVSSAALLLRQGYVDADTTLREDSARLLDAVNAAK
jgi:hypothetical protein